MTYLDATVQAVEHVKAQTLFAHFPKSVVPLWTKLQQWWFKHQLARRNCAWIENPVYVIETDLRTDAPIAAIHSL